MARLEWAEGRHYVNVIKEDRQLEIRLGDCINFTNHIKNRSGKVIHRKTIRAEIKRFEGDDDDDIRIVVHKLGDMKGNMENIGEEITIDPDSYESITHAGCAFRRRGGSRRRVTRRRRRRQAHKPN
jgi:hypothetical protein